MPPQVIWPRFVPTLENLRTHAKKMDIGGALCFQPKRELTLRPAKSLRGDPYGERKARVIGPDTVHSCKRDRESPGDLSTIEELFHIGDSPPDLGNDSWISGSIPGKIPG
jgi:hypothetical protein